jgi:hypothetical protein
MTQPPPFGATPPPTVYGIPPSPRRSNGPAIVSLVLGILGCVPWLTGFLAVVLGILGIRKARDPQVGGKGMAIAGLILGALSFVSWSIFGTAIFGVITTAMQASAPQRAMARQFLADLGDQDVPAAQSMAAPSLSPEEVQALADKIKPWGALEDATTIHFNYSNNNGAKQMTIGGVARFAQGSHPYSITFTQVNNEWKIEKVEFP